MQTLLFGIIGTLLSVGISVIIKGQFTTRKEAKEGRQDIHKKMDIEFKSINNKLDSQERRLTSVESCHRINHPNQL